MRDLIVDLRAARRRLESGPVSAIASRPAARVRMRLPGTRVAIAGAVLLAGVAAVTLWWRPSAPIGGGEKPSVAVLYFENNTGNPSLDWLRTGLTDMLVTDLSQSPDLEVLGTDRLYQILSEMNRQDDRVVSFDTVQEIAQRAGVNTVLLGSYMKAGESIRINIRLAEAGSGRIISAERVEASGEDQLFRTVDDLTRRIKAKFFVPGPGDPTRGLFTPTISMPGEGGVDRDLQDVTTSSIEAYRYYAEGINLHERGREQEAVPRLERAVAIDAHFAMALTKLAVVHGNLGHARERDEYARRAFENADRLTARERYYVEGHYYSLNPATTARAIEAYTRAIEQFPDHASARHNLALIYQQLERYDEAIAHNEDLRRRGMTFPFTHTNLASAYAARGEYDLGYQVLQEFLRRNPDSAAAYERFGTFLVRWGRFDEALAAFSKALALDPDDLRPLGGQGEVHLLRDEWALAEEGARRLRDAGDPFARWLGLMLLADHELYRGRSSEALKLTEAAAAVQAGSNFGAIARNVAAEILLARGAPAQALAEAERALEDARDRGPEWQTLFLLARARSRLGREADARETIAELTAKADALPSNRDKRRLRHLAGLLALERGDAARAVAELTEAEAMLPRGFGQVVAPHVPVWFALGSAHLATGNLTEAAARFQRIVEGTERLSDSISYVRSLYFLGQVRERQGARDEAHAFYRRFVSYWGEGDLDRDRVADARKRLAS